MLIFNHRRLSNKTRLLSVKIRIVFFSQIQSTGEIQFFVFQLMRASSGQVLLQRNQFQKNRYKYRTTPNGNTDQPPDRIQSPPNYFNGPSQKCQKNHLEHQNDPNHPSKVFGFCDISEYIERVVQNSAVHEIEDLEENKNIEVVGVVHRILTIVVVSVESVDLSPVDDQFIAAGLELSLSDGVHKEFLSCEYQHHHNTSLQNRLSQNVLHHQRRYDVVVSSVGLSEKELL